MEREQFLQRIRVAAEAAALPATPDDPPGGLLPDVPSDDLIDRFIERVRMVDGSAEVASDTEDAIGIVRTIVESYGTETYLAWDENQLPIDGLLGRLPERRVSAEIAADVTARLEHQSGYMDLLVGITGADGGLAESGSIVLTSGPGRPRMASAIPLAHIALLRAQDIVPTLSHWIADHPRATATTSNLVVITGPSRTADIEQVLNLGVHGPKHLHVVIL